MDLDHAAAFRCGLFKLLGIDKDVFAVLQFEPPGLLFRRHGLFVKSTDHLLAQSRMVARVQEVELDPLFPDRGMQLHGHVRLAKMNDSFPDRSAGHGRSSCSSRPFKRD